MKKSIIILISTMALCTSLFFIYQWSTKKEIDTWKLIPEDAALILEIKNTVTAYEAFTNNKLYAHIKKIHDYKIIEEELEFLEQELKKSQYSIHDLIDNKKILISAHGTTDSSTALVLFIPFSDEDQSVLKHIQTYFKTKNESQSKKDKFGHEYLHFKKEKFNLFVSDFGQNIVLTFNEGLMNNIGYRHQAILNEDVIVLNKKNHDKREVSNGNISLYLSSQKLIDLAPFYFNEETSKGIRQYNSFASDIFLDLFIHENNIKVSGYCHPNQIAQNLTGFLSSFSDQNNGAIDLGAITDNTIHYSNFNVNNGKLFYAKLKNYLKENRIDIFEEIDNYNKNYNIDFATIWNELDGSQLFLQQEINKNKVNIAVLSIKDSISTSEIFEQWKIKTKRESIPYYINSTKFHVLEIYNLPSMLFGEYFKGEDKTYYFIKDKTLILSSSPEAINTYLSKKEKGRTLKNSIAFQIYHEENSTESVLSNFTDLKKLLDNLENHLNNNGKVIFEKHKPLFMSLDKSLAYFSTNSDNSFVTDISINLDAIESTTNEIQPVFDTTTEISTKNIELPSIITSQLYFVKNHLSNQKEILVQDSSLNMFLVSLSGSVLWNYKLDSKIIGQVNQIDFFSNGNLQYLFTTNKKVYLLDRTGKEVDGYPYEIQGNEKIANTAVFDYDNNKQYRILISTVSGKILLRDKLGQEPSGWELPTLKSPLIASAQHIKVRGKDMILLAEKNKLHLVNRRGTEYDGFPVESENEFKPDFYILRGNNFQSTNFIGINQKGQVIKISFRGKLSYGMSLSANSKITNDKNDQDFIMTENIANATSILNSNGKDLFTIDEDNQNIAQFYTFKNKSLIILEKNKNHSFHNQKGELISLSNIYSDQNLGLFISDETIRVYSIKDNFINIEEIKVTHF